MDLASLGMRNHVRMEEFKEQKERQFSVDHFFFFLFSVFSKFRFLFCCCLSSFFTKDMNEERISCERMRRKEEEVGSLSPPIFIIRNSIN